MDMETETAQVKVIAHIRSDFSTKFGIPRQSGLVDGLEARVVFTPDYRVAEALDGIYSLFGLDFREDGDLIAGLKMHIHGLIDRVKAKAHMQDVFVEEIKRKYPLVFDMGIYVVELLESEGAEAVMPDLMDFLLYSFYNSNFKSKHLGTK